MIGRQGMVALLPFLMAAVFVMLAPKPLWAGWLGVRNQLAKPVVLQVIEKKAQAQPSAVQRLYPGEVTWVWVEGGTTQKMTVMDVQAAQAAQSARKVLAESEVTIGKLDLLYGAESKRGTIDLNKLWEGTRQKDVARKP